MEYGTLAKIKSKRRRFLILLGAFCIPLVLIVLYRNYLTNIVSLNLIDAYFSFLERIADRLLHLIGSEARIQNHQVYVGSQLSETLDSGYLLKKWTLFLLIVCWITQSRVVHKLAFTGLIILCSFIGSLSHIGLSAHLMSFVLYPEKARLIGRSPYVFMMLFLFITWIWYNRKTLMQSRLVNKFDLEFLEKIT